MNIPADLSPAPSEFRLAGPQLQQTFSLAVCAVDCYAVDRVEPASVSLDMLGLGNVDLIKYDGQGLRGGGRTFRQVRDNWIDDFILLLPLTAPLAVEQSGRCAVIEPGMLSLLSTMQPFDSCCGSPPYHSFIEFMVRVPGALLRREIPFIDDCCAIPISARRGAGKVMLDLIETLLEERHEYTQAQATRFGDVVIGALANVAAGSAILSDLHGRSRSVTQDRIFLQAVRFIESELSNPDLGPDRIAEHCSISTSYLHAIFAAKSQKVAAMIRAMRLEHCRQALRDPALRSHLISDLAMRWGFNNYANFTRAYHAHFGNSPSEDRRI